MDATGEFSDDEVYLVDHNDEDDYYYTSASASKLQLRKDVSKACWIGEMGMAEVVEKKGKMWTTTGIIRNGKTYCYLKETLFLAEIGALLVLDDNDMSFLLKDLYEKVGKEKTGCCWQLFEVYRHLKSLGHIIGRHDVPWTMKGSKGKGINNNGDSVSLQRSLERKEVMDIELREESLVIDLFNNLQIRLSSK